jgi:hypothetical protein
VFDSHGISWYRIAKAKPRKQILKLFVSQIEPNAGRLFRPVSPSESMQRNLESGNHHGPAIPGRFRSVRLPHKSVDQRMEKRKLPEQKMSNLDRRQQSGKIIWD